MALRRIAEEPEDPGLPQRALVGATAAVSFGEGSSWKTWKFGNADWQAEVWRLYDIVGELWFLANRVGDSIAKGRLYVTEVDENGEETGETTDAEVARLAAIPLGTGATRDGNLRLAGIDLAAPGEAWLVGEGAAKNPLEAEGSWFVVTGASIKNTGGQIQVRRPRSRDADGWLTLTDGVDILIRCWREHPNDPDQADSFARPGIVPLREIELLTKREFAELDSRLTGAGVWFLPEDIDFPRGADDPAGIAGFMAYMQRAAAASMIDQSTAQAMVPIMATVKSEHLDSIQNMKPINFWSELSGEISPLKEKAINRLASFAEIPAEVLTGIGDLNHWSGWLVSEEGIRWIGGYFTLIADALTRGFLRNAIEQLGGGRDPKRYAFAFDPAPLAVRPNRTEEALQLHDRHLLSDEEAVKAAAFSPEQMPSITQRAQQILIKLIQTQPDLILDPAVQAALGLPQVASVGLPATAQQNADALPGEDPDEADSEPERPEGTELPALTATLDRRIRELTLVPAAAPPSPAAVFNASAKLIVYRALELAGGRLATAQERHGRWAEVPRHELHARVGPISRDKAEKVTAGAWAHVAVTAADLGVEAADLHALLSGYVLELLTRGIPHHDDLLFATLNMAHRGRGLMQAEEAA